MLLLFWRIVKQAQRICALGYNAVWPIKFNRRFGETRFLHLQGMLATCFSLSLSLFFLGVIYSPKDGGYVFFGNIGTFLTVYTASHLRRLNCTQPPVS
jgi:hypothetical protein